MHEDKIIDKLHNGIPGGFILQSSSQEGHIARILVRGPPLGVASPPVITHPQWQPWSLISMVTVLQRTEGGRGAQRQVAQSSSSKRRPLSHTLVHPTRMGHLNSEKRKKIHTHWICRQCYTVVQQFTLLWSLWCKRVIFSGPYWSGVVIMLQV